MSDSQSYIIDEVGKHAEFLGPAVAGLGEIGDQYLLTYEALERTLQGVAVAIKLDAEDERQHRIKRWLSEQQDVLDAKPLSVNQWLEASRGYFAEQLELRVLTDLIIGISYMRARGRHFHASEDALSLRFIWPLIYAALSQTASLFKLSRSGVGFIFVPLCSLIKDGAIEELWRLHVWLPDGMRGDPTFDCHGHNTYGQSWILAGETSDHRWSVEPAADKESATHAQYQQVWSDGKKSDSSYKTHQVSSTVTNTGKYFKATRLSTKTERRDMTYTVSQEEWHSSNVAPNVVCATLFFFDAHRGTNANAAILGSKDGVSHTQHRDPVDNTLEKLVKTVEVVRKWEDLLASGKEFPKGGSTSKHDPLEQALDLCHESEDFPNREYYLEKTLRERQRLSSTDP